MSMYSKVHLVTLPGEPDIIGLSLMERNIYGSSRIGTENPNQLIARSDVSLVNEFDYIQTVGDKRYELSNHLGNVLQVVTDRKLQIETAIGSGVLDYYSADVVSQSDYFPFGMLLPNQNESEDNYRYGFNGMEKDDEVSGDNNSYDFGARFYNPSVGRWLSGDPLEAKYPSIATYTYVNNSPIMAIDPNGKEIKIVSTDPVFRQQAFEALQKLTNEKLILLTNGQVVSYNAMAAKLTDEQKNDPAILALVESYGTPVEKDIQDLSSGTTLVNNLLTDDNVVSIISSTDGNHHRSEDEDASSNGKGSNSTVMWDPNATPGYETIDPETGNINKEKEPAPNYIGLAHELIHADHSTKGNKIPKTVIDQNGEEKAVTSSHKYQIIEERVRGGSTRPAGFNTQTASAEELRTVGLAEQKEGDITEQQIMSEHNLNIRGKY